jgi:hypothetical protein
VLTRLLADGAHPPTWRALAQLGARETLFEPPEAFANINTRQDLAEAASRLAARRPFPGHPGGLR